MTGPPARGAARADDARHFAGDFETHVTVACNDGAVRRLARWAAQRGMKLTHIVLARGVVPSQPMVTVRGTGDYGDQLRAAYALADELRTAGYPPVRIKIEASPFAYGVPVDDAEAAGAGGYFEHHVKVLLPAVRAPRGEPVEPDALAELAALAERHGAHLSRNARRSDRKGRAEHFVTQRCHGVGRDSAQARLARLLDAVPATGPAVVAVEREFVVHDSNLALDAGWMEPEGASR